MSNLPPGVSTSDLPGNRPMDEPECFRCDALPAIAAMEDGYELCDDHDTHEKPRGAGRVETGEETLRRGGETARRGRTRPRTFPGADL